MWLWTTRAGFEADLSDELEAARARPSRLGPCLLTSPRRPQSWPIFGRAGFEVLAETPPQVDEIQARLGPAARQASGFAVQSWVPDHDSTNPLAGRAEALGQQVAAALDAESALAARRTSDLASLRHSDGVLLQICLVDPQHVMLGRVAAAQAPCLAAGGRARVKMPRSSPSRAARKLVEAFEWIGVGPEAGEQVVDLGAAPGGWTAVLVERRARVIAVDPAPLAPALSRHRLVRHLRRSAFELEVDEPVDWVFCDMAWRPLDVIGLLCRWGRQRWASAMVANIKLPMRQRAAFVQRTLKALTDGGWRTLRARQLYHDREEITVAGWLC